MPTTYLSASDFTEGEMLSYLDGSNGTAPVASYAGLFIGSPGDDGTGGTEVTTSIRSAGRLVITWGTIGQVGFDREIRNSADLNFGNSETDEVGLVDYLGIFDDLNAGDLIAYAQLANPINVVLSTPVNILTNQLSIRVNDSWGFTAQDIFLNWIKGTDIIPVDPVYLGLYTSTPNADNSGTEVTTQIRVAGRPSFTWGATSDDGAGQQQMSNNALIDFGASANSLGSDLTHFGIFDAASAGNLVRWGALNESVPVAAGDNVSFPIGSLLVKAG